MLEVLIDKGEDMKKMLIVATMLFTASLMIGSVYFPDTPFMWFAGTSLNLELLRALLIALLTVLLFSNPPRALYIRYTIGMVAIILPLIVTTLAVQYHLHIIDALVFMEVAVIFGLEALETNPDAKKTFAPTRRTPVPTQ